MTDPAYLPSPADVSALLNGDQTDPHRILGAHAETVGGVDGVIVRTYHPEAVRAECLLDDGGSAPMDVDPAGPVFSAFLPGRTLPLKYRVRLWFRDGQSDERRDPYSFLPTLGEHDQHYFGEGTHRRLWEALGAHPRTIDGVDGTAFAVWAPNARSVNLIGEFCSWDGRVLPMRCMGSSGIFELFVPGVGPGSLYKFEVKTKDGHLRVKADPFAFSAEPPPGNASRVTASSYQWADEEWVEERRRKDWYRSAMSIYEVHLGSWARVPEQHNRSLSYREIAPRLIEHVKRLGFTHIELMPVTEHPFDGSWGYQTTGYFAPTSRFGDPDDFRFFVDSCHQNGIGVILDWVPAHFPKDDFALRLFDGTALYEHEDPKLAEHPDWGTLVFNFGRNEVRNFLIASALYWLSEYHIDGLRVDAVASMLYRDYSREEGQWIPHPYGGRQDLEAVGFLRAMNEAVRIEQPGCITIAEESTAWPAVTKPVGEDGLGFTFKWNMGWMHDTLQYFSKDPVYRRYHQNDLTFAMIYEYTETFIMPLSHDEVVHGKKSLLDKMPGDAWQKFAGLRTLLTYQYTRPGKQLLFMGTELAPWNEWDYRHSLDWHLAEDFQRQGLMRFLEDMGALYRDSPCLWSKDPDHDGFQWIDAADHENSIISYMRWGHDGALLVLLNFTPVPRASYRIGVPHSGSYVCRLSSDDPRYQGSGWNPISRVESEQVAFHGQARSICVDVPPLAALILEPEA